MPLTNVEDLVLGGRPAAALVPQDQDYRRVDWRKSMDLQSFAFSQRKIETSRCPAITSAHFRGRATRYRLAAAMADNHPEARRFRDLAMMFEKIADGFSRFETKQKRE